MTRVALRVARGDLAVCRLPKEAAVPELPAGAAFASVTRTARELSVVVPEPAAPPGATVERGFRAMTVEGPLPFDAVGVLASVATPLADAGISLLAIGTFDTDWVLVRGDDLARAVDALRAAGHTVFEENET